MTLIAIIWTFTNVSVYGQTYPNQLANACIGRRNGDFARDLTSCQHYFYCEDNVAYRGVCNGNRLFSAENVLCVSPQNQPCFQCSRSVAFHLTSVPHACQHYVQCFRGRATLHFCPRGLVFDGRSGVNQCNIPPSSGVCFRENGLPQTDVDTSLRCPPIGNQPLYQRHPQDCSIYFVCSGGVHPQRILCQNGLHFNLNLGVCDFPENARCTPTTPPQAGGPAVPCNSIGEFVPDRTQCDIYHICISSGTSQARCESGSLFDHVIRDCTRNPEVRCWATDNQNNHGPAVRCQFLGEFVPDRIRCNFYHVCIASGTQELSCAPRLGFDHIIRDCVSQQNARCWARDNNPGNPDQPTGEPALRCQRIGEYVPDRRRCEFYHICTDTGTREARCNVLLSFDHVSRSCRRRLDARCWAHDNNPGSPPPNGGGAVHRCRFTGDNVPDRVDCQIFHACLNDGTIRQTRCPGIQIFDHIRRMCVNRAGGRCWAHDNGGGNIRPPPPPPPSTHGPAIRCPQIGAFVPDRARCNFFHICLASGTQPAQCEPNLLFDHIIRDCVTRHTARCWTPNSQTDLIQYSNATSIDSFDHHMSTL